MLRIKELRKERALSQRTLAEKIGCSQKSIDYWEKGEIEPTAHFIAALADFFECSADYLLGREDDYGNVNVECALSSPEQRLLQIAKSLPEGERQSLMAFAEFLVTHKNG